MEQNSDQGMIMADLMMTKVQYAASVPERYDTVD